MPAMKLKRAAIEVKFAEEMRRLFAEHAAVS